MSKITSEYFSKNQLPAFCFNFPLEEKNQTIKNSDTNKRVRKIFTWNCTPILLVVCKWVSVLPLPFIFHPLLFKVTIIFKNWHLPPNPINLTPFTCLYFLVKIQSSLFCNHSRSCLIYINVIWTLTFSKTNVIITKSGIFLI